MRKNLVALAVLVSVFMFATVSGAVVSTVENNGNVEAKNALLREMFDLMEIEKTMKQMGEALSQQMKSRMPEILKDVLGEDMEELPDEDKEYFFNVLMPRYMERISREMFASIDMKSVVEEIYIPIYSKYFSVTDIQDMIAFYKSPTGKKLLELTPKLTAEAMGKSMELITPAIIKSMENVTKDMKQEVDGYFSNKEQTENED